MEGGNEVSEANGITHSPLGEKNIEKRSQQNNENENASGARATPALLRQLTAAIHQGKAALNAYVFYEYQPDGRGLPLTGLLRMQLEINRALTHPGLTKTFTHYRLSTEILLFASFQLRYLTMNLIASNDISS